MKDLTLNSVPETYEETCQSGHCSGFPVAWGDWGEDAKWVKSLISVITNEFGSITDVCEVCEDIMKGSGEFNEFNNW